MRAWRLVSEPSPDPDARLELADDPAPPPEPTGRDVLVRVHAASLNFRDVMILRGDYALRAEPGRIPLSDGAGEIIATGPYAHRFEVGDRVVSTYFPQWQDGQLRPEHGADQFGASRDGLLADHLLCEEHELVSAPEHLSFVEAATLPCSALTAWSALTGPQPVLPGQTVLTLGTGGVALFAVQLAQLFGARVVAATSSQDKAARLRELGADEVIDYHAHPDWHAQVLDATDGRGADRVVETVGPDTLERSIRSTAVGGEIAHVGGGGFSDHDVPLLDTRVLHGRSLSLRRVTVGSRRDFERMNAALSLHRLRPVIDQIVPFVDAPTAYRRIQDRVHIGKIVIELE